MSSIALLTVGCNKFACLISFFGVMNSVRYLKIVITKDQMVLEDREMARK